MNGKNLAEEKGAEHDRYHRPEIVKRPDYGNIQFIECDDVKSGRCGIKYGSDDYAGPLLRDSGPAQ